MITGSHCTLRFASCFEKQQKLLFERLAMLSLTATPVREQCCGILRSWESQTEHVNCDIHWTGVPSFATMAELLCCWSLRNTRARTPRLWLVVLWFATHRIWRQQRQLSWTVFPSPTNCSWSTVRLCVVLPPSPCLLRAPLWRPAGLTSKTSAARLIKTRFGSTPEPRPSRKQEKPTPEQGIGCSMPLSEGQWPWRSDRLAGVFGDIRDDYHTSADDFCEWRHRPSEAQPVEPTLIRNLHGCLGGFSTCLSCPCPWCWLSNMWHIIQAGWSPEADTPNNKAWFVQLFQNFLLFTWRYMM